MSGRQILATRQKHRGADQGMLRAAEEVSDAAVIAPFLDDRKSKQFLRR
jgi:hypothetical protein